MGRQVCGCGSGRKLHECCRTPQRAAKVRLEVSARRLSAEGRHAEAAMALEKRLALSPENPMIWNDLGNEYAAAGELEKARAVLQRAVKVDPGYPLPLYNLGVHTLAGGMAWEAIGYLKAFVQLEPGHAGGHQNLARAYGLAGEAEMAERHLAEACRLDPELETQVRKLMGQSSAK